MSDQPQWMTPEVRAVLAEVHALPHISPERRLQDIPWDLIEREHARHAAASVRAASRAQEDA